MEPQTLGHLIFIGETVLFFVNPTQAYPQPRAVPAFLADIDIKTNQAQLVIFGAHAGALVPVVYTQAPMCDATAPIAGHWAYRVGRAEVLNKNLLDLNEQMEHNTNVASPKPTRSDGGSTGERDGSQTTSRPAGNLAEQAGQPAGGPGSVTPDPVTGRALISGTAHPTPGFGSSEDPAAKHGPPPADFGD